MSQEQLTVQVIAHVDTKLWNAVSPVLHSLPTNQHVTIGGTRYGVRWSNFQVGDTTAQSDDSALAAAERTGSESAFVERPLTAAESKAFASVPVWLDADVLLARADSSLCSKGLSLAAVRGVLSGTTRTWAALGVAPPAGNGAIHLTASSRLDVPNVPLPEFGLLRFPTAHAVAGAGAIVALNDPLALVVMPWSAARSGIDHSYACAIPVDGHSATAEAIRAKSYPGSYTVYWVYRRLPRGEASGKVEPLLQARDKLFRAHLAQGARRFIVHPSAEFGIRLLP